MKFKFGIFAAIMLLGSLALACRKTPGRFEFCTQDRVYSVTGYLGTVVGVFNQNEVMVKFDQFSRPEKVSSSQLAVTEGCTRDQLCVGANVISRTGYTGRVVAIANDHKVIVKFDQFNRPEAVETDQLAEARGCVRGQGCVGDRVISISGYPGKITGVLSNGDVTVKFDQFSKQETVRKKDLAITKGCGEHFCVGERVVSTTGYLGVVEGIANAGGVMVKFDQFTKIEHVKENQLGKMRQGGCTRNGFCVSDTVYSSTGYEGEIIGVLRDGNVIVKFRQFHKPENVSTVHLAITMACTNRLPAFQY